MSMQLRIAHTTGFEEFERFVAPFTLERTAAETGLAADELHGCRGHDRLSTRVEPRSLEVKGDEAVLTE